jgi:hypothetical protein
MLMLACAVLLDINMPKLDGLSGLYRNEVDREARTGPAQVEDHCGDGAVERGGEATRLGRVSLALL